jgi:hypothetical protein
MRVIELPCVSVQCKPTNVDPVMMMYKDNVIVNEIISKVVSENSPVATVVNENGESKVWVVSEEEDIVALAIAFEQVEHLYIADGHHRTSAACQFYEQQMRNKRKLSGHSKYLMAMLFPQSHMRVISYNRCVNSIAPHTEDSFMDEIDKRFYVRECYPFSDLGSIMSPSNSSSGTRSRSSSRALAPPSPTKVPESPMRRQPFTPELPELPTGIAIDAKLSAEAAVTTKDDGDSFSDDGSVDSFGSGSMSGLSDHDADEVAVAVQCADASVLLKELPSLKKPEACELDQLSCAVEQAIGCLNVSEKTPTDGRSPSKAFSSPLFFGDVREAVGMSRPPTAPARNRSSSNASASSAGFSSFSVESPTLSGSYSKSGLPPRAPTMAALTIPDTAWDGVTDNSTRGSRTDSIVSCDAGSDFASPCDGTDSDGATEIMTGRSDDMLIENFVNDQVIDQEHMLMYMNGRWFELCRKIELAAEIKKPQTCRQVDDLGVQILTTNLLTPILSMTSPSTDKRMVYGTF